MLNSANVSVYPVDVRGMVNSAHLDLSRNRSNADPRTTEMATAVLRQISDNRDTIDSFQQVAGMTGGKAFVNRNDLDVCFDQAVNDSADYYLLGYYLKRAAQPASSTKDADPPKQKKVSKIKLDNWRRLQVKMATVKGAEIRARSGFYAEKHYDPVAGAEAELREAIFAPIDYTAVEIYGKWTGQKVAKDGKKVAEFVLYLPPNFAAMEDKRVSLDFLAAAKSPEGRLVAQAGQRLNRVIPDPWMEKYLKVGTLYRHRIELPPGEYQVRFIVRDNNSGRTGSVTAPLKVE
jgi:hypothetical protein